MLSLTLICSVFISNTYAIPTKVGIVGGDPTDILQHPWQVSFRYYDEPQCGGSIISDSWVITAAHCTIGKSADNMTVKVGSSFLSTGGEIYNVSANLIYPGYTLNNDIALLKLFQPIDNINASAIALPSQGEKLEDGTNLTVTGWGSTTESGPESEILLEVVIPTVSESDCRKAYGSFITDNMICAGLLGIGGKGSCSEDYGGPAVVGNTLYGIVSFGTGCGRPDYPGVYTKVSNYVDWINSHIEIEK